MNDENKKLPACRAVIVTYNNADSIGPCLDALFGKSTVPMTASVVDNSPSDATARAVEACRTSHPDRDISLIRRPENIGFAAGCNLGAKNAGEEFLLFLNPDTAPENDVPGILTAFLARAPELTIAGPQIRDSGGDVTVTCRRFPTPAGILLDATGLDRFLGACRMFRFDHAATRQVDQIIGACMAIRRRDFEKLGGFDERFFIYYEEVDLCKRALEAGGGAWFVHSAVLIHQAGTSAEAPAILPLMPGYLRRSRAEYFAKHYGLIPQFLTTGLSIAESAAKACLLTVQGWLSPETAIRSRARRDGFVRLLREWKRK